MSSIKAPKNSSPSQHPLLSIFVPGSETTYRVNKTPPQPLKQPQREPTPEPLSPDVNWEELIPELEELAEERWQLDRTFCRTLRRSCIDHIKSATAVRVMRARGGTRVSKPCLRPVLYMLCPCKGMGPDAAPRREYMTAGERRRASMGEDSREGTRSKLLYLPGYQTLEIGNVWVTPNSRTTFSSVVFPSTSTRPPKSTVSPSRSIPSYATAPPTMTRDDYLAEARNILHEMYKKTTRPLGAPPSPPTSNTRKLLYKQPQNYNTPLKLHPLNKTTTITHPSPNTSFARSCAPSQDPTSPQPKLSISFRSSQKRKRRFPQCTFCHGLGHESLECPVCDMCLCIGHRRGECVLELGAAAMVEALAVGARKEMWKEGDEWKVYGRGDEWVAHLREEEEDVWEVDGVMSPTRGRSLTRTESRGKRERNSLRREWGRK